MPKITNDDFYPNVVTPEVTDELVCLQGERVKKMTLGQALSLTEYSIDINDTDTEIVLTAEDLNGILVVDSEDPVDVYLPDGAASDVGKYMEFHRIGDGSLSVWAGGIGVINDSAAGGSITSSRAGQTWAMIRLRLIREDRWAIVAIIGTWVTA